MGCRSRPEVRMAEASSESCWNSLSRRWVSEAASRPAGREQSFRRQSRTVRRIRPFHHRHDTHRRIVLGNCRQSIVLVRPFNNLYVLIARAHCWADSQRLRIAPVPTGKSNRPRYLRMYKVPMAATPATPSPVDESSGFKLSDQSPDFPRHGVAMLFFWRLSPRGDGVKERSPSQQPRAPADSDVGKRPEPAGLEGGSRRNDYGVRASSRSARAAGNKDDTGSCETIRVEVRAWRSSRISSSASRAWACYASPSCTDQGERSGGSDQAPSRNQPQIGFFPPDGWLLCPDGWLPQNRISGFCAPDSAPMRCVLPTFGPWSWRTSDDLTKLSSDSPGWSR